MTTLLKCQGLKETDLPQLRLQLSEARSCHLDASIRGVPCEDVLQGCRWWSRNIQAKNSMLVSCFLLTRCFCPGWKIPPWSVPHSMPTARADFQHHCIMRMNICHLGDAVNSEHVVPSPHTTALSGRKLLHCLPGITYVHEGYGLIPCGAATGMRGRAVMSLCYDGTLPQQAAQRQVIICTVTMAGPAAVLEHHNLI